MPTLHRKRRRSEHGTTQSRRASSASPAASSEAAGDSDDGGNTQGDSEVILVKKLVRYALASEYSRSPLRRTDMSTKIMPQGSGRRFQAVFKAANEQLGHVFGMQMLPLPQKEKVTITQKRAAMRAGTQSQPGGAASANKSYILTSTLPQEYRSAKILPPAQIPTPSSEGSYLGFVSFVVGLIYLSAGCTLAEARLEKQLKRVNADDYLCGERSADVLKRMIREGYIVKIKERDGGDETVDYHIGPRAKVEIGKQAIADMARTVYDKTGDERAELERRLSRSLGNDVSGTSQDIRVDESDRE